MLNISGNGQRNTWNGVSLEPKTSNINPCDNPSTTIGCSFFLRLNFSGFWLGRLSIRLGLWLWEPFTEPSVAHRRCPMFIFTPNVLAPWLVGFIRIETFEVVPGFGCWNTAWTREKDGVEGLGEVTFRRWSSCIWDVELKDGNISRIQKLCLGWTLLIQRCRLDREVRGTKKKECSEIQRRINGLLWSTPNQTGESCRLSEFRYIIYIALKYLYLWVQIWKYLHRHSNGKR
jgi:hypothetical protein